MGESFEQLRDKSLLQVTLPGSHNSGNYEGGLRADVLCESDYRYNEYLAASSPLLAKGVAVLSQTEFDRRMIPWNINHFHTIKEQLLLDGVRYLHLKICNFDKTGKSVLDLASITFQHRGYTTRETVKSTLQDVLHFLHAHPREIVILAFNNLHNNASKTFSSSDVEALSAALEMMAGDHMMNKEDFFGKTLGELVGAGRRLAVFVKGVRSHSRTIPSENLVENWDPAMANGNLTAAKAWLVKDLAKATKFYVMQANPNNAERLMYEAMNSGRGAQSNLQFLANFLSELHGLVVEMVRQEPAAHINVIDTDFLSISRPYQTSVQLMGIAPVFSEAMSTSTVLSVGLLPVCLAAASAVLVMWTAWSWWSRRSNGYQRHVQ